MAGSIKGITIEIGGNVAPLNKALDGVNKKTNNLQTELKQVERLLKLDPTNTTLLAQKQKLLAESIAGTKDKLDTLKEAEKQVQVQFEKGEASEEQYRALQREIIKTETNLKLLESQAKNSNDTLEKVGKAIGNVGDKATKAGTTLTKTVTAGVVGLGAAGVAAAMELDNGYDTIIKKTGATGESLEELKENANNIFTTLPTDMDKAGVAVGEVNTRFGATGKTLEDLSTEFIKFAEINETDLNSSIGNTDKIMEQWGIDAKETANVLGLLTKKSQETGISTDTLMGSLQTNGSTFKEMGLNMVQSTNLLAEFEANGVNADTAIAGLKKSIKNYTDEGKSTDEALKLTIDQIKNAATETEALSIAQETFGVKGATEMKTAIREGRISVDDLSSSMGEYKNTVTDTFEATLDPWDQAKVATNNLKVAASDLGGQLMNTLQPIIQNMVSKVKEFTEWFKGLNDQQKETIIQIALVAAAIGPMLIIFGSVAKGISNIITLVTKIGPIINAAKGAFAAFNAVLAANPIILIVVAIAAIIAILVLLYNKCEWFRDAVNAIGEAIKNAFFAVWDGIANFFTVTIPGVFNRVINFVKNNWQGLLLLIVNPFAGAFKLLYDNLDGFRNKVDSIFNGVKDFIGGVINKIKGFFSFDWELPKIKLPHFDIKGKFSLSPPQIPKLSVDWYKTGAIFNSPSVIGVGEAGAEAVLPIEKIDNIIASALKKAGNTVGGSITIQVNSILDGNIIAKSVNKVNLRDERRYNP